MYTTMRCVDYSPPEDARRVARDRASDILHDWGTRYYSNPDLMMLLESVYLQGVHDAVVAMNHALDDEKEAE